MKKKFRSLISVEKFKLNNLKKICVFNKKGEIYLVECKAQMSNKIKSLNII